MDNPVRVLLEQSLTVEVTQHDDQAWHMSVTQVVDPATLTLVTDTGWYRESPDGQRIPLPQLDVPQDVASHRLLIHQVVDAIAFLFDTPITLSVRPNDHRLLPESDEDGALLRRFGTDRPLSRGSLTLTSPGGGGEVTADAVTSLLQQHPGTRIYSDAMKTPLVTARFRELWKVLESAFGLADAALVAKLGNYEPIEGLVDEGELKAWLVLRGRASHAQSRAGIAELAEVERLCQAAVDRLKRVVERVIATKSGWGHPTVGWLERLPEELRSSRGGLTREVTS
jgi:hypothetical protein